MSRTDNTRPIEVAQKDRKIGRLGTTYTGNTVLLIGGVNSDNRQGKEMRKNATIRRRQHERRQLIKARHYRDIPTLCEMIDIPPIPQMRRSVGWRYAQV